MKKGPAKLAGLQTSWGRLASDGEPEPADVRCRVSVRTQQSRYGNATKEKAPPFHPGGALLGCNFRNQPYRGWRPCVPPFAIPEADGPNVLGDVAEKRQGARLKSLCARVLPNCIERRGVECICGFEAVLRHRDLRAGRVGYLKNMDLSRSAARLQSIFDLVLQADLTKNRCHVRTHAPQRSTSAASSESGI